VRSHDGLPLDVDVTLPAEGEGPWPAIAHMHGFGGDKTGIADTYGQFWAQRGLAVVTWTARGFGRSCGTMDSRTEGCERGWTHLADQRYEIRDAQFLLGTLVDEGIANPSGLGAEGGSYGGGQSITLAFLNDRMRLPGGDYVPWTSPNGTPLHLAAALAGIGWSDLGASLMPNGHFVDFRVAPSDQNISPIGTGMVGFGAATVAGIQQTGFVAPEFEDLTADLVQLLHVMQRGDPYDNLAHVAAVELAASHSGYALAGTPAPMLLESGWNDDLFPVQESLRVYNRLLRTPGTRAKLYLVDVGHPRGTRTKGSTQAAVDADSRSYFQAALQGNAQAIPIAGPIWTLLTTCGKATDDGPIIAPSWIKIHPGAFHFGTARKQAIRSSGGNPEIGEKLAAAAGVCDRVPSVRPSGEAFAERKVPRKGFTLLGQPTVSALIASRGEAPLIAARLWDVGQDRQMRLIGRNVYRLTTNQSGRLVFQVRGNGYRLAGGHTVRLELGPSDAPQYRANNTPFRIDISNLKVEMPTHERPLRKRGIDKPVYARLD
jgi:fermentation-respiration switch protein FrsA (DUF1100 family)